MITAIIETHDNEIALAHALAALVPAATEGVVRDVVVIDHGSTDGTLTVADAAGCTIIHANEGGSERRAAEEARGDWLLFLSPPSTLVAGWQAEALAVIDRAGTRRAIVRRGHIESGWWARLHTLAGGGDGRLIAKRVYLAARATSSLPASATSSASGVRRGAA